MAEVRLEQVSKVFPGGVRALDGLTLSAADGELVAIVGPSGCGKTTTLRVVAGLEDPTDGLVRIGGRVVNAVPPQDRDVAMVFQQPALFPQLTVAGNLGFGLRARRTPTAEVGSRVREVAGWLGLADQLDRYPAGLSGGQQQRVAIGRALVRRPACFLMDEPLSNLDTPLRLAIRSEVRRLQRRTGTTTLFVTHDPEEAMALGDRAAVLAAGRVVQAGPPEDVYRHPQNRFVLEFFGTGPANVVDGELVHDGGPVFVGGGLRVPLPGLDPNRTPGPVVLGLRPENASVTPPQTKAAEVTLRVVSAVPGGGFTTLIGVTPTGQELTVRVPGSPPAEGTLLRVYLDPDGIHLFEPGPFGRSLMRSPGAG